MKEKGDRGREWDKEKSLVCDLHHDIEECQVFLGQTMEDRTKTLGRRKLCYGYLVAISKEHNTKSCANRIMCKFAVKDTPQ